MRCDSCSIGVPGAFLNCFSALFSGNFEQVSKHSVFCQSLGAQGLVCRKTPDAPAKKSPPAPAFQCGRGGKPTGLHEAICGVSQVRFPSCAGCSSSGRCSGVPRWKITAKVRSHRQAQATTCRSPAWRCASRRLPGPGCPDAGSTKPPMWSRVGDALPGNGATCRRPGGCTRVCQCCVESDKSSQAAAYMSHSGQQRPDASRAGILQHAAEYRGAWTPMTRARRARA
ncbi:hypothetical protein [Xanthomonas oryzae pv. oryzae MAFF 311018]|nr:hypothetical protein [Xanthomonas oryzae pv. oryzae MAFF 311018]